MEDNVFLFLPNLIGYVRIALSFVSFYYMYTEPGICVVAYLLSHYLDDWDGWVARKYNQGGVTITERLSSRHLCCIKEAVTNFGAILDISTDRITFIGLLMGLCHLYPQYTVLFQTVMMVDICGNWILTHATLLCGFQNHKVFVGEDPMAHPFLRLFYTNEYVLWLIWAGNHIFYSFFYLCYFSTGPAVVVPVWNLEIGLWAMVAAMTFPTALLFLIAISMQLLFACRKIAAYDASKRHLSESHTQ